MDKWDEIWRRGQTIGWYLNYYSPVLHFGALMDVEIDNTPRGYVVLPVGDSGWTVESVERAVQFCFPMETWLPRVQALRALAG